MYSKAEGLRSLYCFAMYRTYVVFPSQDQLSADMYNFASKEGDYARYYVTVGAPQFNVNDPERKMEMRFKYGPFHYNHIVWCCLPQYIQWFVHMTCVYVCVSVIRNPGRLPPEVSGSSGGSYTDYPNTARWTARDGHSVNLPAMTQKSTFACLLLVPHLTPM